MVARFLRRSFKGLARWSQWSDRFGEEELVRGGAPTLDAILASALQSGSATAAKGHLTTSTQNPDLNQSQRLGIVYRATAFPDNKITMEQSGILCFCACWCGAQSV